MIGLRQLFARWEVFLLIVLVAIFLVGGEASRYFLTTSNVTVALEGVAPMALLALTMTLIVITGEIDISSGLVGLCASAMAVGLEAKFPIGIAILIGVAVGLAAGAFNGLMVSYAMLPSLVVTIGTLALYRASRRSFSRRGASARSRTGTKRSALGPSLERRCHGDRLSSWSCSRCLRSTFTAPTGEGLYAIGNNREAARFSGLDVKKTVFWLFVASGAMSALAAIVLTAYLASARSDTATGLESL